MATTVDVGPLSAQPNHTADAAIDFIGGVAGGTASVYVGQPLDTVKVKMQTFPTMYKNAFSCFASTFRKEGIARGLYAGTTPSLWAQVSENAILFMAYGMCQKAVMNITGHSDVKELGVLHKATAGGCAAFFSSLTLCPTELIKCKQQAMQEMMSVGQLTGERIGPWGLTKQILREEGLRGMFRGLVPTFAREMPGYFFFFGGYEMSRSLLTPPGQDKDNLGTWQTVTAGGIGGLCMWLSIFPADLVKSRAQVSYGQSLRFIPTLLTIIRSEESWKTALCGGIGGATLWILVFPTDVIKSRVQVLGANEGIVSVFLSILKNEGFLALYKGLGPTLLRTFPATGALFLAYENSTKILNSAYYGSNVASQPLHSSYE